MKKSTELTITNKEILPVISNANELEITDHKSLSNAVEYLSRANKYLDSVVKWKEGKTKPLNDLKKIILAETKPLENALEEAIDTIRKKMSAYQTSVNAKLKADQEAIANRIGSGKGNLKVETAVRKIEELGIVDRSVESTSGKVSFKTVKKFEVVDITSIPMEYHIADEIKIRDLMKAGVEIAGVRYYEEQVPINFR